MADLQLTVLQMSAIFSAFTLAYSIFEIPSGWLADVRGPRLMLTRIVLWWSAFTMLTGVATGFRSLLAIRFLFGAGEAGAFPTAARSFSSWFPLRERGTANGVLFLGSRLGGMLSVPLALLLIRQWGWRQTFVVFGTFGIVWAAAWYAWYRDRPADHREVNAEELAWIEQDGAVRVAASRTPWRKLLASRNLLAICAMYFAFGYGLYFYFTWLPTYLIRELGFSVLAGGLLSALPFALAGVADLAGGRLTDYLARVKGLRTARCHLGFAVVSHVRSAGTAIDLCAAAAGEGGPSRVRTGLRRPRAECLLGGLPGRRRDACGRGDGIHEHVREPRRADRPAGARTRRRSLALVDLPVLCHRGGVCRRRRSRGSPSIHIKELLIADCGLRIW